MAGKSNGRHARKSKRPRRMTIALMTAAAALAVVAIAWYLAMATGLVPTTGAVMAYASRSPFPMRVA